MQVHITARHLDLTPALTSYVKKKIDRIDRHFSFITRAQIILSVEKLRHTAEIIIHAQGHHDFRTKAVAADLYAAVDMAMEKLHKHMARQKDKRVQSRRKGRRIKSEFNSETPEFSAEPPTYKRNRRRSVLPLTSVHMVSPPHLTYDAAVAELEQEDLSFLLFRDEDFVHVLYRRKDKTYGILKLNTQ